MLKRRFYYALKPFLPWGLRMAVRRVVAKRKRAANRAIWPVNEQADRRPAGWPGWPERKKFAFVLTHDVEGPDGVAKCRQLAEVEMKLGFRSSFNFIPEGTYSVPDELRHWLTENGFEVGVHDLHHDGKLYQSRRGFAEKAQRINHYLKDWGVTGFRSGFMLHELEWIHDLNIRYDASTFDTDPFEPQPDAAGTVFPFWIPAPAGSSRPGYVELPYTLPQDSTLFLVLAEKSPEIWTSKLDWLASRGAMALVNVHPDYVCFDGGKPAAHEFPVAYYEGLLSHVRTAYAGQYWQPCAVKLAEWYAAARQR